MDPDAERLVLEYRPIAHSIARQIYKTAPHALDVDELIGVADLGLTKAGDRWEAYCSERGFDPRAEQFFEPYVRRVVYGAVRDHLRAMDWATRSQRFKSRRLIEAGQDSGVSISELAQKSGLSEKEVKETIVGMSQRPVSIEAEEIDYASPQSVESSVAAQSLLEVLVRSVRSLEPECQAIIVLHYYKEHELKEVARMLGIAEARASQLHTKSVLSIHEAMLTAATEMTADGMGS